MRANILTGRRLRQRNFVLKENPEARLCVITILMLPKKTDSDLKKGAHETERPDEISQANLNSQIPQRTKSTFLQETENDFPEPGGNPEHSGQTAQKRPA